nr:putative MCP chaperone [Kaumoebavirus]
MSLDIKKILAEIAADPTKVEQLDDETIKKLASSVSPYKSFSTGEKEKHTVFSITNMKERYMTRFLMTSFISFINRMLHEHNYDFDLEYVIAFLGLAKKIEKNLEEAKELAKSKRPDDSDLRPEELETAMKPLTTFLKRSTREFLNTHLKFNPDDHVRASYVKNDGDPERPALTEDELKKLPVPPADTFERWRHYQTNHYDQLKDLTNMIYCEKPDVEYMINVYRTFDNVEEANKFKKLHYDDTTASLISVKNGQWAFLGDWAKNNERVDFYEENSEIMKQMIKQNETETKLATEMTMKRKDRLKKKSVRDAGPDHEKLSEFIANHPTTHILEDLNVKRVRLSNKEIDELSPMQKELYEDIQRFQEKKYAAAQELNDECPEDAVEVGIVNMKGATGQLEFSKMYTQAEAPTMPAK